MSHTDKDRPYNVRAFFEGELDHDHTSGVCRPETLITKTSPARRYGRHNCGKLEVIEFDCPGFIAKERYRYDYSACSTIRREFLELERQVDFYEWRSDTRRLLLAQLRCYSKRRFCGRTHTRVVHHRDWPCNICDALPTCHYYLGWKDKPYRHVPAWYINHNFRRPERRRVRDQLDSVRRYYNADPDYRIFDENVVEENQHRHAAGWYWY